MLALQGKAGHFLRKAIAKLRILAYCGWARDFRGQRPGQKRGIHSISPQVVKMRNKANDGVAEW